MTNQFKLKKKGDFPYLSSMERSMTTNYFDSIIKKNLSRKRVKFADGGYYDPVSGQTSNPDLLDNEYQNSINSGNLSARDAKNTATGSAFNANSVANGITGVVGIGATLLGASASNAQKGNGDIDVSAATKGGIASGAASGMSTGSSIGSIAGPLGTAIGAGVGAIAGGIFGGTKAKSQAERMHKNFIVNSANSLSNKQNSTLNNSVLNGLTENDRQDSITTFRMGGVKMYSNGTNSSDINSFINNKEVLKDPTDGTIESANGGDGSIDSIPAYLPGGTKILSSTLKSPVGKTYAELAKNIPLVQKKSKEILSNPSSSFSDKKTAQLNLDNANSEFDKIMKMQESEKLKDELERVGVSSVDEFRENVNTALQNVNNKYQKLKCGGTKKFADGGYYDEDNGIRIDDNRTIRATTGNKINPNKDLKSGTYNAELINEIAQKSIDNGYDPYTAIAVGLHESNLGDSDENIGHTLGKSNKSGDYVSDMINTLKEKADIAKKNGYNDEEHKLQYYNGTGKLHSGTERKYYGHNNNSFYGVEIPKGGSLDLNDNPLYGKEIKDIRDNVIKKNDRINNMINKVRQKNVSNTLFHNADMPNVNGVDIMGIGKYACGGIKKYADGGVYGTYNQNYSDPYSKQAYNQEMELNGTIGRGDSTYNPNATPIVRMDPMSFNFAMNKKNSTGSIPMDIYKTFPDKESANQWFTSNQQALKSGQGVPLPFKPANYADGGLSRDEDYGSSERPYPSVNSNDFAGGNRSYPIPTIADARDALRLAGMHGRSDVKSRVYSKYPSLKKYANGTDYSGTYAPTTNSEWSEWSKLNGNYNGYNVNTTDRANVDDLLAGRGTGADWSRSDNTGGGNYGNMNTMKSFVDWRNNRNTFNNSLITATPSQENIDLGVENSNKYPGFSVPTSAIDTTGSKYFVPKSTQENQYAQSYTGLNPIEPITSSSINKNQPVDNSELQSDSTNTGNNNTETSTNNIPTSTSNVDSKNSQSYNNSISQNSGSGDAWGYINKAGIAAGRLMDYIPGLYDLGRGRESIDYLNANDYTMNNRMDPYKYNIDPQFRQARENSIISRYNNANRNTNTGSDMAYGQAVDMNRNKTISDLYSGKYNMDKASSADSYKFNSAIDQYNKEKFLNTKMMNMASAAKGKEFTSTGIKKLVEANQQHRLEDNQRNSDELYAISRNLYSGKVLSDKDLATLYKAYSKQGYNLGK